MEKSEAMTTALIAEDEALMRERLKQCLAACWPELEIIAEAADGESALSLFAAHQPDIVFLDIRMPGKLGTEVAAQIGARAHVVFTTAYDDYAVEAFDNGAVDYLLKPIDAERLAITVSRLKKRLQDGPAPQDLSALLSALRHSLQPSAPAKLRWIKASLGNQIRLLAVDDVLYFQADTKYTRVVLADSEALIRTTLKELLDGLDGEQFWQIHRGVIVNVSAIQSVTREGPEKLSLHLKGRRERLTVSRQFFPLFKQH